MYACAYLCVCVCVCVCVCGCIYIYMYVCRCVYVSRLPYARITINTHTHTHMYIIPTHTYLFSMCVYMCVCVCVCVCVCELQTLKYSPLLYHTVQPTTVTLILLFLINYLQLLLVSLLSETRDSCRGQLKYDGTRTETRFRLSAKRTSPFKSVGGVSSVDYWQPRCGHQR